MRRIAIATPIRSSSICGRAYAIASLPRATSVSHGMLMETKTYSPSSSLSCISLRPRVATCATIAYALRPAKKSGADTFESHVFPHGDIDELYPNRLWRVRGTLPRAAPERNMTIYRLPNGGLLLHSVVALDEARMTALEALGAPEVMIVPNRFHRADAAVYKQRYPNLLVVTPKVGQTQVQEKVEVTMSAEEFFSKPAYGVTAIPIDGISQPGELAYIMDLSGGIAGGDAATPRALVLCDLLFNIPKAPSGAAGLIPRLLGSIGPLAVTGLGKLMYVKNKAAVIQWLRGIADGKYDFRVLTVAHGDPCCNDVNNHLRAAAARLEK